MMSDLDITFSQQQLLKVLKREGYQTVSELHKDTSFAHDEIRKDLAILVRKGLVFNLYKLHKFSIYLHKSYIEEMVEKASKSQELEEGIENKEVVSLKPKLSLQGRRIDKEELAIPLSVPFMTINHKVGYNRIIVLKRIRDRLIEDYHPVLNAVIADYEQMMPTED
jgi:hypothetical protein